MRKSPVCAIVYPPVRICNRSLLLHHNQMLRPVALFLCKILHILPPVKTCETMFTREARIFKALMHPSRIAILEALRDGEQCVCHLEALLNMRQAYISQQLAVLRKAGIIADRRCGLNIFYRIVKPEALDLIDLARAMTGSASKTVRSATSRACSCPKCVDHISQC